MLEDRDGHLWFGGWGGVSRYDGGHFEVFNTKNGLANNGVMGLLEDSKGNLWVGTWSGISRFITEAIIERRDHMSGVAIEQMVRPSDRTRASRGNG